MGFVQKKRRKKERNTPRGVYSFVYGFFAFHGRLFTIVLFGLFWEYVGKEGFALKWFFFLGGVIFMG